LNIPLRAPFVLLLAASLLAAAVTATAAPAVSSPAPCLDEAPPPGPERAFHVLPAAFDFGPPTQSPSITTPAAKPKKHFWVATAEVMALEVVTWAFGRYYLNAPYSRISLDVWKTNLKTGFVFDQGDNFPTNQAEHVFHGSFYYNAARTNGFNLWESALFTTAGSVLWEYFGENQLPSTNDVLNTAFGGVTQGEIVFRLSTMLLDNRASGLDRLGREVGAFLLNPIGGVNRLFRGEMKKDFPNPEDRLPEGGFSIELDAGYQHLGYGTPTTLIYPNQGLFSLFVRYGDPFSGPNRKPFDYFEALLEVTPRSNSLVSGLDLRGPLASWGVSSSPSAEHRLGIFLTYDYNNNQSQIFSSQAFSANLLSRFKMAGEAEVRTELAAVAVPMAALQVDYTADDIAAVNRPYDYTLGGGVRVQARLYRRRMDLLSVTYKALWLHTVSGIAENSAVQTIRLEGRLPIVGSLAAGGAWTWNRRITSYQDLPTARVEGSQWRIFGVILLQ
jgi:hypothetical protein